jgi:hypothetical protein
MKVLLIEDEKQLRTLEIRMLKNLGHEAIPCETAEKGFTVLENNPDGCTNRIERKHQETDNPGTDKQKSRQ